MCGRASRASRCSWRRCATSRWRCRPRAARCTTRGWMHPDNAGSLAAQLQADILRLQPARLVMTAPGDWRVLQAIKAVAEASESAAGHPRRPPLLRQRARVRCACQRPQVAAHGVLLPRAAQAARRADARGGRARRWPVELRRRQPRGLRRRRPGRRAAARRLRARCRHARGASRSSTRRFADHPGRLDSFAWPVTRAQALQSLAGLHRASGCRCSAATRTRCGRATRGCTTRTCRPRST